MECQIAEGMVTRYINHTLSVKELEAFLEHIRDCSSCYDELETYFIVHEAMQQLDEEEEEGVLDFKELLEQDIRKSRIYIAKEKLRQVILTLAILFLLSSFGAFLFYVITQVI